MFSIVYWSLKDSEQGEGLFGRQQPGDESDAIRKKLLDLVKGSGIALQLTVKEHTNKLRLTCSDQKSKLRLFRWQF